MAKQETAIFAGGCFWCVEAVLKMVRGVAGLRSGYIGGGVPEPSYEAVCAGTTGHAEAVEVIFDPATVTLDQLLDIFFTTHDPTQLNRQGNDVGTQYRSAVFYLNDGQKAAAEAAHARAGKLWDAPIVTEIVAADKFYPADASHQDFYARNPDQPYCQMIITPKLSKARAAFRELLVEAGSP